jgi:hypothetical protein
MRWKPFHFRGNIYNLSHLHPCSITYEQAARGNAPARVYKVDVIFGLHCFTRGAVGGGLVDRTLLYSDDRETRSFDFARYELSKLLPELVRELPLRKCFHTGKGNFFTIEMVREDGKAIEYDVFFAATRSSIKGRLNLFVQSAYVRDREHA